MEETRVLPKADRVGGCGPAVFWDVVEAQALAQAQATVRTKAPRVNIFAPLPKKKK
jgi:hypothetical protein